MKDANNDDSISSVLKQLVNAHIFESEDKVSLIDDSYIIKMDGYPKDGPIAKAIVYFLMSKLNNIFELLDKQAVNDEVVQIRHFSIIDEAHYMLDFDNRPLRNLIAVGRNKGLSIILATQNMSSFKSKGFDFYANAFISLLITSSNISGDLIAAFIRSAISFAPLSCDSDKMSRKISANVISLFSIIFKLQTFQQFYHFIDGS